MGYVDENGPENNVDQFNPFWQMGSEQSKSSVYGSWEVKFNQLLQRSEVDTNEGFLGPLITGNGISVKIGWDFYAGLGTLFH